MAIEITLPRQSEKLDESLITFWHISEGDPVEKGDPLLEVQTEKAVTEIEAPESGVIKEIIKKRGDSVKVGELLAVLDTETEEEKTGNDTTRERSKDTTINANQETEKKTDKRYMKKATPRAKKIAKELGVDWQLVIPSGKNGKVTEEDIRKFDKESREQDVIESVKEEIDKPKRQKLATPAVRKFARENNISVEEAMSTYFKGENQTTQETASTIITEPKAKTLDDKEGQKERRVPLTGIRKAIARGMVHSRTTIPHVTHFDEVKVEKLVEIRNLLKAEFKEDEVKLTYLAFVVKAFTGVLRKYPFLNASFDDENEEVILKENYHIGFATDTERGLLVPVIKQADKKSLFHIAQEIQDLAAKAREGSISREEMSDATATISNVGSAHGSYFTPIINPPESSILGIGRIEKKAIVSNEDTIEIQPMMALSLSYDHRLIDGVMAQEAMNELKKILNEPALLLAR